MSFLIKGWLAREHPACFNGSNGTYPTERLEQSDEEVDLLVDKRTSSSFSLPPQGDDPAGVNGSNGGSNVMSNGGEPEFLGSVNQYDFTSEMGSGAQGTVYKSISRFDGRVVAVIVMEGGSSFRRNPEAMNEVAIMKRLNHPNLVNLIDVIEDRVTKTLNIVMEFVNGGAIIEDEDIVDGTVKPMSEKDAKHCFRQLIMGLEYLHHHGVLHRDIKPSNMLVDRTTGKLKICDLSSSSRATPRALKFSEKMI